MMLIRFALPTEWAQRLAHRLLPDCMTAFRPTEPAPAHCRSLGGSGGSQTGDEDEDDALQLLSENSAVAPFDQVIASMLDTEANENSSTSSSSSSSGDSGSSSTATSTGGTVGGGLASGASASSTFISAWASLFALSTAAAPPKSTLFPLGASSDSSSSSASKSTGGTTLSSLASSSTSIATPKKNAGSASAAANDVHHQMLNHPPPAIVDAVQAAIRGSGGAILVNQLPPTRSAAAAALASMPPTSSFAFSDLRVRAALLELMVQILAPYRSCVKRPPEPGAERMRKVAESSNAPASAAVGVAAGGAKSTKSSQARGSGGGMTPVPGGGDANDEISWSDMFDTELFVSSFSLPGVSGHSSAASSTASSSSSYKSSSSSASATSLSTTSTQDVQAFVCKLTETQAFQSFVSFVWRPDQKAAPVGDHSHVTVAQDDPNVSTLTLKNVYFFDACITALAPHVNVAVTNKQQSGSGGFGGDGMKSFADDQSFAEEEEMQQSADSEGVLFVLRLEIQILAFLIRSFICWKQMSL